MTINEFIELLKAHDVDFDKDLAVCRDAETDGNDFWIEEGDFCVFLVCGEWGTVLKNSFIKGE